MDDFKPTWDDLCEEEPELKRLLEISQRTDVRKDDGGFKDWRYYEFLRGEIIKIVGWKRPRSLGGKEFLFSNRAFDMAHVKILGNKI